MLVQEGKHKGYPELSSETSTAMVKSVDLASLTTTLVDIITTSRSKLLSTKNGRALKHALEAAAPICGCGESYAGQILDAVTSETSKGGRSHQLLICNDLAMRQATKRLMIQACKYKNSTVVCWVLDAIRAAIPAGEAHACRQALDILLVAMPRADLDILAQVSC